MTAFGTSESYEGKTMGETISEKVLVKMFQIS
jgi:hypothetical protein